MQDLTQRVGGVFEDRYRVEAEVGRGSMAVVFRAIHLVTEQVVALKVMQEAIGADESRARRFLQEIRATARLSHPNTVRVLDAGRTTTGLLWLAMEYLEGESLRQVLDRERVLAPSRAMHIARQVARALVEAHSKYLVHRDLKPDNILLTQAHGERDVVKVLDFGVAKFLADQPGEEPLTRTGDLLGTPLYLAPEQALERSVDGRTDLYSLGCILMEMLTGAPPFRGATPVAIVMHHIHDPAPRLSERLAGVPDALEDLLASMLAKDPSGRPESVQKWLQAAERLPPLPEQPFLPRETSTNPSPEENEAGTVLLNVTGARAEIREAAAVSPVSPIPASSHPPIPVPPAPPVGTPRPPPTPMESEEDVVFLEGAESGTLLLPQEEAFPLPQAAIPPRPAGVRVEPRKSTSRRRGGWVAAALGLVLGAAGVSWWMGLAGSKGPPGEPSRNPEGAEAAPVSTPDIGAPPAPTPPTQARSAPAPESPAPEAPPTEPPPEETVEISLLTDPPGAEVLRDGSPIGRTPHRLQVRASDPAIRLTLKAPGYRDLSLTLLPRDILSSGRRDLTWQLQKEATGSKAAISTPGPRGSQEKSPPAPAARPPRKPVVNWDE